MKHLLYFLFITTISSHSNAQYEVGTSYFGINDYIEYIPGNMPVIIVAPHAGVLEPEILPDVTDRGSDNGTMELIRFMADSMLYKSGGCRPHIIINHLRPSKLNPVYAEADSTLAAGTNPITLEALNDFYGFIQTAYDKVTIDFGKGHYFELHGNGTPEEWNMIGLGVSKTYLNLTDPEIEERVDFSTIKNLCTVGGVDFLEAVKGPTSLGGMLQTEGWKSTTSPTHPAPPDSVTFFFAGQNTWRYGSRNEGTIDATHIESYWKFMVLADNRSAYSNDLADAILSFMGIHYGFSFDCGFTNINAENQGSELVIFPNPIFAGENLIIKTTQRISEVTIFNSAGQKCINSLSNGNQITVDLDKGIYTVVVKDIDGNVTTQKLVVQ